MLPGSATKGNSGVLTTALGNPIRRSERPVLAGSGRWLRCASLLPPLRQLARRFQPIRVEAMNRRVRLTAWLDRMSKLANELVQLARIEARLAIVLASQVEKRESILVGGKATVGRLVQIDEATLNDKHDQRRFW